MFTSTFAAEFLKRINERIEPALNVFNDQDRYENVTLGEMRRVSDRVYGETMGRVFAPNFTDETRKKLSLNLEGHFS